MRFVVASLFSLTWSALAVAETASPDAPRADVSLLGACPGEDAAKQMRLVWHSSSPVCELAFGVGEKGALSRATCAKTVAPTAYTGRGDYYRYTAELEGLRPGTRYTYRVVAPGVAPSVQSFKTAPLDGEFNFLWIGDIHSTPNRPGKITSVVRLVANAEAASAERGGISFVLSTGDMVKHGQTYACWTQWDGCRATSDYMVAAICGNKEYYRDEGKERWHNRWFVSARNDPPNGAEGLKSTYWFLYGGVMFVGLDTLAVEGREMDEAVRRTARARQIAWLERVAAEQKGRYRFLVVFQHYPYFKASGPCCYGGYDAWRDAFDRHGVDFALSGDSHSYVRSRRLRGGVESDDGTVYVVCPEIDSRLAKPALAAGEGLVARRDKHSSSSGACWFSVGRGEMTLHYICEDASDCDTVTVKARPR